MGDVWDRTVEFIGDHLGAILPIALLAILVPASLSGSLAELQREVPRAIALTIGVVSIGLSLVQLWGQLAIVALASDPSIGRQAGRIATARLLPTIGVYLLVGLLAVVLLLPLLGVVIAAGVPFDQLRSGAVFSAIGVGTAGMLLLCAIALLIVALIVAARLAVLLPVLAMERRGAGSIMRSIRLTRGCTLRLIGVMILYGIVFGVAVLAVQAVFGSALRLLAGGGDGMSIATVVTTVIVAAVTTAFTVLATAFMGKLYTALRTREGAPHDSVPEHP